MEVIRYGGERRQMAEELRGKREREAVGEEDENDMIEEK